MAAAALNISSDQVAQLWNKKGLIYRKAGKLVESIECYDKALEIDPSNAAAWSNKARALDEMSMLPEALKCYKKALQLNPNSAGTWNNQGYGYRKLKRFKEALECYDRAIQLWPQYDKAWFNKGYIYEQQERYLDALECFNYAIEFNPENEKYTRSREIVFQAIKQQQQQEQKPESPPPPNPQRSEKRDKHHAGPHSQPNSLTSSSRGAPIRSPAPDKGQSRPSRDTNRAPSQPLSPDPEEDSDPEQAGADAYDNGAPLGHLSDGEVRPIHIPQRTSPGSHHQPLVSPHGSRPPSEVGSLRETIQYSNDAGAASNRYHEAGPSISPALGGNPFGFETADEAPEPGTMPPPARPALRTGKSGRNFEINFDSLPADSRSEEVILPQKSAQTPTKQNRAMSLSSSEESRLQAQLATLAVQELQQSQSLQQSGPSSASSSLSQSRRSEPRPSVSSSGSRGEPAVEIRSGQQTPNSSTGDLGPREVASPRFMPEEADSADAFDLLHEQLAAVESIEGVYVFESRVEELLGAVRQRKQELQSRLCSTEDVKCSICLDEPPQMICIPCGHLCLCENCSKKLTKKKCPICNLRVKNIYKVFKA